MNHAKVLEWDDMTPQEKAKSARAMEAYAAMVECIDTAVGRLLNGLEDLGVAKDTLVIFMSDK